MTYDSGILYCCQKKPIPVAPVRHPRWKAANNRAKEFNKHFSAGELALLAGGCVIGGLGAFAATPEFAGYTIPEGCIAGGLIFAFGEGFGFNSLAVSGLFAWDLYFDFKDIDEQYRQELQACNQL